MRHLIALSLLVAASACAHAKKDSPAVVEELRAPAPAAAPKVDVKPQAQLSAVDATKPEGDTAEEDRAALRDLEQALAMLRDTRVFFETDEATITKEGAERLTQVGAILAKHPKLAVRIEGNCDERGTEDYNLVLGQKRAAAAKTYLVRMGAKEAQVATLSYGAEHPRVVGHDENAWSQNRRAEVVVTQGAN